MTKPTKCGCKVYRSPRYNGEAEIKFCQLHSCAEEMLEMLKALDKKNNWNGRLIPNLIRRAERKP